MIAHPSVKGGVETLDQPVGLRPEGPGLLRRDAQAGRRRRATGVGLETAVVIDHPLVGDAAFSGPVGGSGPVLDAGRDRLRVLHH